MYFTQRISGRIPMLLCNKRRGECATQARAMVHTVLLIHKSETANAQQPPQWYKTTASVTIHLSYMQW